MIFLKIVCAGAERHDAAFLEPGGESLCECW
jgi:hypothetical protein